MNVLSLFDGMSCGQIALNELGIGYDNYYASEIDVPAMSVTKKNFPNTIHLGDVRSVNGKDLPRIDLLIGGSPCQSFSFAGKRKGMSTKGEVEILTLNHYLELKSEQYEFEGQSYLFWEYMRVLNELREKNPEVYFFLENVEMGDKWERVLSRAIGVNGIHINSSLLSAQNRERIYWLNWGLEAKGLFGDLYSSIPQPKDKGIFLRDILEENVPEKYYLSQKAITYLKRAEVNQRFIQHEGDLKAGCVTANYHKGVPYNAIVVQGVNKPIQLNASKESNGLKPYLQNRVYDINGKFPCLNTSRPPSIIENRLIQVGQIYEGESNSVSGRVYSVNGKSACLSALGGGGGAKTGLYLIDSEEQDSKAGIGDSARIRRLTPTECEALQTVPKGYTSSVKDTNRYKMLGNGWTIEVIKYLFSYLPFYNKP
jgi:DNA (cytosine-5)-methyltransferase 3A